MLKHWEQFEYLRIDQDGGVLTCAFNRPDARNSFCPPMRVEVEDFFRTLRDDTSVRVVILTGTRPGGFCAGGDTKYMQARLAGDDSEPLDEPFLRGALDLVRVQLSIRQPVIAAVHGDAVGLGATLALLSDVVLMSETARIGDPHVRAGLVAGDGGCLIWPMLLGPNKAKQLLMTGRLLRAAEAHTLGLTNELVPDDDQLMARAEELAGELAGLAPFAVQWTKLTVNKTLWHAANLVLDTGLGLEALSAQTHDHLEGLRAINEKRRPQFHGN